MSLSYPALPELVVGKSMEIVAPVLQNSPTGVTPVYSLDQGALPNGMTLDRNTGALSGTPLQFTAFAAAIKVTSGSKTAVAMIAGDVTSPLGIEEVIAVPCADAFRVANPTASYYVDSIDGKDTADGRTPGTAWKSLAKVNALTLKPGNVINLARDSVWKEQIRIKNSGTADAPIVVQAYGSGDAPLIQLFTGENDGTNGVLVNGNYVHVLDLQLSDIHWSAIHLDKNSQHVVVAGNEIYRCGMGIDLLGKHQRALSNHIHDMTMVVDTGDPSTAWGANGIGIMGEDLEIAWNRFVNCRDECKNFGGWDGGAIEYYGYDNGGAGWNQITSNVRIHHNYADACDGFLEANGRIKDMVLAHNLFINIPSGVFLFHMLTNKQGNDSIKNTYEARMENNTLIGATTAFSFWNPGGYVAGGNKFVIRNNIAVVRNHVAWDLACVGTDLVHDHNLFQLSSSSGLGFNQHLWTLDGSERVGPAGFVDQNHADYRLAPTSDALGRGASCTYDTDLLGNRIPANTAPDLGAYQR